MANPDRALRLADCDSVRVFEDQALVLVLEGGCLFEDPHEHCYDAQGMKVSPHRPDPWIDNLSEDRRCCTLLGYNCVADFELSPENLASLAWEILDKLQEPERALFAGECQAIDIGLYQGGKDIRVWKVWYI